MIKNKVVTKIVLTAALPAMISGCLHFNVSDTERQSIDHETICDTPTKIQQIEHSGDIYDAAGLKYQKRTQQQEKIQRLQRQRDEDRDAAYRDAYHDAMISHY